MHDWSEGYVKGIDYTYECYRELNPRSAALPLLHAGIAPPTAITGACCELGFGFGMSTNMHAAASNSSWWGTDFNPSQAGFAQELARNSGARANLFDQSFAEFCNRSDLPDFDFIGLHGIWSWVSDESRRQIVDFIRRRLRVGGLVYISYNSQPGWAQMMPVRQLLIEHAHTMSAPSLAVNERIEKAIDYVAHLIAASPGYAALNPGAAERIKSLKALGSNYLAHEYFNRDWQPMMFSEFASWMEPAKLGFACSASPIDQIESFNLLPGQAELLGQIPDPCFRQSARDLLINRQFRKDYWIKGARRLDPLERRDALLAQRIVLAKHPDSILLKEGGALTPRELEPQVYGPLLEVLADRGIKSLGEVAQAMPKLSFEQLVDAVMVPANKGDILPAQDEAAIAQAQSCCARLNQHLLEASIKSQRIHYLASPVSGGALLTQPMHMQILLARQLGLDTPAQWAQFLLTNLSANGACVTRPDGTAMSEEEGLLALTAMAKNFETLRLPFLQALKAVD